MVEGRSGGQPKEHCATRLAVRGISQQHVQHDAASQPAVTLCTGRPNDLYAASRANDMAVEEFHRKVCLIKASYIQTVGTACVTTSRCGRVRTSPTSISLLVGPQGADVTLSQYRWGRWIFYNAVACGLSRQGGLQYNYFARQGNVRIK